MILEIEIPEDKLARVKAAFEKTYGLKDLDKPTLHAIVKNFVTGIVKGYEEQEAVRNLEIPDAF